MPSGTGLLLGRPRHALRPDRAVGPGVHLAHLADGAGLEPLLHQAQPLFRVALIAHLRDDLVLARRFGQGARLADGAGQRLLHVDVLAELHRRHGHEGVRVIGRRDDDRVDVLLLLEHHAVVLVLRGRLREVGRRRLAADARVLGGLALVDVAERDDVVGLHRVLQVARAHAVRVADDGHVDGVAGGLEPRPQHVPRHDRQARGRRGHGADELPA